jgi:phosphopantothenoylcysteine decarboxylase/phosphopantothenate--cysteine ligase
MAHGIADNLLLTTYMSAKCSVMVAPAMDLDMYQHPANLKNIDIIRSYGNIVIEATHGELASGLTGQGRLEEPEAIVEKVRDFFSHKGALKGKRYLVTAGPTYENIDPVRFIGNDSSGKMGFAIAETLAFYGADVDLITGPSHLRTGNPLINLVRIRTAEEMYQKAMELFPGTNGAVLSAAVSDFKPAQVSGQKVKKDQGHKTLELQATKDIARDLGNIKNDNQLLIGFALETQNELPNAMAKLHNKNLDFIVLNSLAEAGTGFQVDTNKVTIIDKQEHVETFELKSKQRVARDIVCKILEMQTQ